MQLPGDEWNQLADRPAGTSRGREVLHGAIVAVAVGVGVGVGAAAVTSGSWWSGSSETFRTVARLLLISAAASVAAVAQLRRDRQVDLLRSRLSAAELANLELQRLNAGLQRFAGAVAHDLRSPMSVVVSTLELLDQRATGLTEGERTLVQTAARRGRRCVDLTHVLLAQTKRLAAHVERGPVSLGAVVDDALDQLAADVARVRPELRIGPLPVVLGNRTLLVQVFQNLFSNALRYSHPDRPCRIHVTAHQVGDTANITVADDGRGVPPEERDRIFRFGASEGGEGTGIGLATASALVAAHGGTIAAQDGPLAGIAIVLTLPVAEDDDQVVDLGAAHLGGERAPRSGQEPRRQ